MNKTKKYYVDNDGNMIGYTRYLRTAKTEVPAEPFRAKLKMKQIGWTNSGVYFILEDENGKTYNMNDAMFKEYISKNEVFLEEDWDFYQQGTVFSIGMRD